MAKRRGWRVRLNRAGQIVIPALFVVPSLALFVYLLYETAKLSKDKIRHQFALDTAAFVEMGNYSDFLNRTAYVNGAFPARVGYEAFHGMTIPPGADFARNGQGPLDLYQYFSTNGLLPVSDKCSDPSNCSNFNTPSSDDWGFKFQGGSGPKNHNNLNWNDGDMAQSFTLFSQGTAMTYEVFASAVYGSGQPTSGYAALYNLIYALLTQVENSQILVFQRFQGSHFFFQRAYQMNVPGEKATAMGQFPTLTPVQHQLTSLENWCSVTQSQTEQVQRYGPAPIQPLTILTTVSGLGKGQGIDRRDISQPWDPGPPSSNRFAVDLRGVVGHMPIVHCQVEVSGGTVWPGATPRYQVRLYP